MPAKKKHYLSQANIRKSCQTSNTASLKVDYISRKNSITLPEKGIDMMEQFHDLQSLWNKLHTDSSQESFNNLAHQLFSHYVIKRGEIEFRFLEVELYYFCPNHQDWRDKEKRVPFVYERYCSQTGTFFQHQSGVDICFAGKVSVDGSDSDGGGILIRSLLRINGNDESVVTGPWDCADALFQYMTPDSVPVLSYLNTELCPKESIKPTKRCHANCLKDAEECLCFYDSRYVFGGKWANLNHIELERYKTTKRCTVKNTYNYKPWTYSK